MTYEYDGCVRQPKQIYGWIRNTIVGITNGWYSAIRRTWNVQISDLENFQSKIAQNLICPTARMLWDNFRMMCQSVLNFIVPKLWKLNFSSQNTYTSWLGYRNMAKNKGEHRWVIIRKWPIRNDQLTHAHAVLYRHHSVLSGSLSPTHRWWQIKSQKRWHNRL